MSAPTAPRARGGGYDAPSPGRPLLATLVIVAGLGLMAWGPERRTAVWMSAVPAAWCFLCAGRMVVDEPGLGAVDGGLWLALAPVGLGLVFATLAGVTLDRQRRENATAGAFGSPVSRGVWRRQDLELERRVGYRERRFLDHTGWMLRVPNPAPGLRMARRTVLRSTPTVDGPAWERWAWMGPEAEAALVRLHRAGGWMDARRIELPHQGLLTPERLAETLERVTDVQTAMQTWRAAAIPRAAAEARSRDPYVRGTAWVRIADHLPEAAVPELVAAGLADPDPLVRAVAAALGRDVAGLAEALRTSGDPEVLRRAIDGVRAHPDPRLVDLACARLGIPPEEAWLPILSLLRTHGRPAHLERLTEIVTGDRDEVGLWTAAEDAALAIRARAGADGRLSLAAEGGELALSDLRGAVGLPAPEGTAGVPEEPPPGGDPSPTHRSGAVIESSVRRRQ